MKKKLAVVLATTTLVTGFATGVMSKGLIEKIEAELRGDFTIVIDGKKQTFRDVSGKKVDPILYDGTTYLPVRAIGEMMDKTVYWYQDEKKIELVDKKDSIVTDADVIVNGSENKNPWDWNGNWNDKWNEANNIGINRIKEIILKKANLKQDNVVFTKIKLGYENKALVYEVAFETDEATYEYKLNALTGEIIDSEKVEKDSVTLDKAKEIALKKAGLKGKKVEYTKAKKTTVDGKKVYEIEFVYNKYEYEFEIDVETGKINEWSKEKQATKITLDAAKEIALKKAGLKGKKVTYTKAELDEDDGKAIYEIEFIYNKYEYSFEIDAEKGDIIEWEKELDD